MASGSASVALGAQGVTRSSCRGTDVPLAGLATLDGPCFLCGSADADPVWTTPDRALGAPFAPGRFDVVTALHVLEHVPDPVRLVRRMVDWLAPGGLLIIEVPNAGGLGARLFGRAWSGLELPRHLSHFSPETLRRAVERAGGSILWCWHRTKPRHYLRGLRNWLQDRGLHRIARLTERRVIYGALKLILEVTLPLASRVGYGEVIRIGVVARRTSQR